MSRACPHPHFQPITVQIQLAQTPCKSLQITSTKRDVEPLHATAGVDDDSLHHKPSLRIARARPLRYPLRLSNPSNPIHHTLQLRTAPATSEAANVKVWPLRSASPTASRLASAPTTSSPRVVPGNPASLHARCSRPRRRRMPPPTMRMCHSQ